MLHSNPNELGICPGGWKILIMRRREFITLVGGSAVAWPLAARAQQSAKVPRVGFLFYGSPGPAPEVDAFRQGLRELGYIEGQNITVEYRFAGGRIEQLPELAAELVRLKLDVIVTPTTAASRPSICLCFGILSLAPYPRVH
jgi:putative tryptophan/tyrosine transport system substrate-binding protein